VDRVHHHGGNNAKYGETAQHFDMFIEEIFSFSRPAHKIQKKGPAHCGRAQNEKQIHKDRIGHILPETIKAMMIGQTHGLGCVNLYLGEEKKRPVEDRKQKQASQYRPLPPGVGFGFQTPHKDREDQYQNYVAHVVTVT
jgi:hypothetical protein